MARTKVPSGAIDAQVIKGALFGLKIGPDPVASATRIKISSGANVGSDDGLELITATSDISINSATTGANGLDSGSMADATWYNIFMIFNPVTETVAGLLSTSSTSPTLPSGYTLKRRVGAAYYLTATGFRLFYQRGCKVTYSGAVQVFQGLPSSGWNSVALATNKYMPSSARWGSFQIRGPHTGMRLYLSPDGVGTHFVGASGGNSKDRQDGDGSCELVLPTEYLHFYRESGNSENTCYIWLSSYEDDLV